LSIEELAEHMTAFLREERRPPPCTEEQIEAADRAFARQFSRPLPEAYKRVLRRANGLKHNGLILWPIKPHFVFQQTVFEANEDLRDNFSDKFVYFGQRDEELYVFDNDRQRYVAIEFVGKSVWMEFNDDVHMFEFMMHRAWD
jgi:hypothetical protein